MVYNPNIPAASDLQSNSQSQILANFSALDTTFAEDHSGFSAVANLGLHKQVTLYEAQSTPTLAFPASMVYSVESGISPNRLIDLFFSTKGEGAAQANYQLTNLTLNTGSNLGTAGGTLNYIDTPWNLRIYYGRTIAFSAASQTVLFPVPFSDYLFSTCVSVTGAGDVISTCQASTTQLALGTSASVAIDWSAVGRL